MTNKQNSVSGVDFLMLNLVRGARAYVVEAASLVILKHMLPVFLAQKTGKHATTYIAKWTKTRTPGSWGKHPKVVIGSSDMTLK